MKKYLFGAALALLSTAALAGPGGTGGGNAQTSKLTGKNAISYPDGWYFGDSVTCNETQHPKFDTVSCTIVNPYLPAGSSGTVEWLSDFGTGQYGTLTYTVSADGLSYTGQVTYN